MQAPSRSEAPFVIDDRGGSVYGVSYPPPGARPGGRCCILLNPLDNEANNATRFYVRTARALSAAGIMAVRFDYRGTGNSSGRFSEVTAATLLSDITLVRGFVERAYGPHEMLLAGARFGGFLALLYASERPGDVELILWDPILDMQREFRTNFVNKTSLMRKMMSDASGQQRIPPGGPARAGEVVELSCVPFGRAFVDELGHLTADPGPAAGRLRGLALLPDAPQAAGAARVLSALEHAPQFSVRRLPVKRCFVGWGAEDFSERSELAAALAGATFEHLAGPRTAGVGA